MPLSLNKWEYYLSSKGPIGANCTSNKGNICLILCCEKLIKNKCILCVILPHIKFMYLKYYTSVEMKHIW